MSEGKNTLDELEVWNCPGDRPSQNLDYDKDGKPIMARCTCYYNGFSWRPFLLIVMKTLTIGRDDYGDDDHGDFDMTMVMMTMMMMVAIVTELPGAA